MKIYNLARLNEELARSQSMLNDAQRVIDDGLHMAAIIVALADGKDEGRIGFSSRDVEHIARGMMASRQLVRLASHLTQESLTDDHKPTRGGLLRIVSDYYNTTEEEPG